ncbi:MAG: hypothetical protein PWP49_138 [Thermococcaceae archaeon]|jgi:hypothetical protein|nr:hypothetical protein [Thermococcaceae archaeon]MDN5319718.1 hypothetical protein [Thermococcaceae archaeon]
MSGMSKRFAFNSRFLVNMGGMVGANPRSHHFNKKLMQKTLDILGILDSAH